MDNPIYKTQLLFDIDNDFDNELLNLINKLTSLKSMNLTDENLKYYDIQRRKEDFEAIITHNNRNYQLN